MLGKLTTRSLAGAVAAPVNVRFGNPSNRSPPNSWKPRIPSAPSTSTTRGSVDSECVSTPTSYRQSASVANVFCQNPSCAPAVKNRSLKSLVNARCAVLATLSVTCPRPPPPRLLSFSPPFWLDTATSTPFSPPPTNTFFVHPHVPPH